MGDDILQEQIAYYRARANEYDESLRLDEVKATTDDPQALEFWQIMEAVQALPPVESILELAGGTGIWTELLAQAGQSVTVVDASPEMIEINRNKLNRPHPPAQSSEGERARGTVEFVQADLFTWKPDRQYDRVFFAFWLSHIPPERLDGFLDTVREAVRPGGQVFMVDEWQVMPAEQAVTEGIRQARTLADGRQFTIVKVYYDPAAIREKLIARGFEQVTYHKGNHFFHLSGQ